MSAQPLSGITVVDFTTLLPGPLATLMLAEAGATVIKIERPGGEEMRAFPPAAGQIGALYAMLNRGKRGLEIDLKSPEGREQALTLIETADIVVEQFRPGVMDRLGLGAPTLRVRNPRLIQCSISSYGQSGPRAAQAGHDSNFLAVTGLLALSCGRPDFPVLPPAQFGDIAGGSFPAVINILMALYQRERTGQGQTLDIAMADAMFTFALFAQATLAVTGICPSNGADRLTGASPRYRLYAAADNGLIAVASLEQKFWTALCDVVGLPQDLRDDTRDPQATIAGLSECFAKRPVDAWIDPLQRADCCATPLATLEDAFRDPHFIERGLFDFTVSSGARTLPAIVLPLDRRFRGPIDARPPTG